MIGEHLNHSARVYDFASHRMQRLARQRQAAGATQRFLWGYPGSGVMQAVEFSALKRTPSSNALAR
jgi:hypothetical protein